MNSRKQAPPQKEGLVKRYRKLLITIAIIGVIIAIPIIRNTAESNKKAAAEKARIAAEQARIAADPITAAGLFNASNKARASAGAQALVNEANLTNAAQQKCDDMAANNYFEYKNPTTGKDSNSYIMDNKGDLYITHYISDIGIVKPSTETATDYISKRAKTAPAITDTRYNAVGWAVCQPKDKPDLMYIVAMEVTKEQKPATATNNYYQAPAQTQKTNTKCPSRTSSYQAILTDHNNKAYAIYTRRKQEIQNSDYYKTQWDKDGAILQAYAGYTNSISDIYIKTRDALIAEGCPNNLSFNAKPQ